MEVKTIIESPILTNKIENTQVVTKIAMQSFSVVTKVEQVVENNTGNNTGNNNDWTIVEW